MDKKRTYSKALPIVTGIIFIAVLISSFMATSDSYSASEIYVTAITSSAACFTGSVIWYMKKAQRENVYKLQTELYKTQARLELENLEKRLQLEQKYHVTRDELDRQRMDSQLDDMAQSTLMNAQSFLEEEKTDVNTAPEFSG